MLSAVFNRFLEDNKLIDPPMLAGAGDRLQRARDEHEVYFRSHPTETDREYLLHIFNKLAKLPGAKDIFGEHNPIHELPTWLSGDAVGELLKFFQRINPETGTLVHDFTDPDWDTRFLGDLYQDLSERARKKYALLQTPEFVEEFILDRTLDPAIDEFGLEDFRMIDPACGSGHFLLGSFHRLLERWQRKEPATNVRALAQRAFDSVYGVDVNPSLCDRHCSVSVAAGSDEGMPYYTVGRCSSVSHEFGLRRFSTARHWQSTASRRLGTDGAPLPQ